MHVRHPNMHGKDVHVCGRGADGRITETTRDAQHTLVVASSQMRAFELLRFQQREKERETMSAQQQQVTC